MPFRADGYLKTHSSLDKQTAEHLERRRQVRGLLLLALAAIVFAILHAGIHNVFTRGWWRLW
jgi:hypothetical protein